MTNNILIPTDFSRNAWQAVQYALVLFKNNHCNIHLVNAFEFSDGMSSFVIPEPGEEDYESAKFEAEAELSKVSNMMALKPIKQTSHHFIPQAICGEPLEVIQNYVTQNNIDLVVMGTHGRSESDMAVYGSVAVNVMEKVRQCPVMVVPLTTVLSLPKEIVFPTKFKSKFTESNMTMLHYFTKMANATIQILHIFKSGESHLSAEQLKVKNNLQDLLDSQHCDYSFRTLYHQEVETGINCFIESRESDMVCFLNKKHSFFGSILSRPLVKQITFYSRVPILVLHE